MSVAVTMDVTDGTKERKAFCKTGEEEEERFKERTVTAEWLGGKSEPLKGFFNVRQRS